jgi:hypothetical protein
MLRKEIERDMQGPFWNLIEFDGVWLSSEHLTARCRVYDACADSCVGLSCARSVGVHTVSSSVTHVHK